MTAALWMDSALWRSGDKFVNLVLTFHFTWVPGIKPSSLCLHGKMLSQLTPQSSLGHFPSPNWLLVLRS